MSDTLSPARRERLASALDAYPDLADAVQRTVEAHAAAKGGLPPSAVHRYAAVRRAADVPPARHSRGVHLVGTVLDALVVDGRLTASGNGAWTRYHPARG